MNTTEAHEYIKLHRLASLDREFKIQRGEIVDDV